MPLGGHEYDREAGRGSVFGFAGEQLDARTGLIDLRARWYDPRLGRFVRQDSLLQGGPGSQGFNRFAYVGNRPTVLSDPSGKSVCELTRDLGGVLTSTVHVEILAVGCAAVPQPPTVDLGGLDLGKGGGCQWTVPELFKDPLDSFPEQGGHTVIDPFHEGIGGVVASDDGGNQFTPDQQALVELAKEAQRRGKSGTPISQDEGQTLVRWGDELNIAKALDHTSPDDAAHWVGGAHVHVGPINHIKVQA